MSLANHLTIQSNRVVVNAYAKINLSLDVIGKRADSYHYVDMIMQSVNLYDTVSVHKVKQGEIIINSNVKFLPTDSRNIAYKAAKLFIEHFKINCGVRIYINKRIPIAAGLAGGSCNAAAVLCAMNVLFDVGLSIEELVEIGKTLGADVSYCFYGNTMRAEGIGEKLTKVTSLSDCYVVLVKPPVSISTASVYKALDLNNIKNHPNTKAIIEALDNKNLKTLAGNMSNVLETVTIKQQPIIKQIKGKMLEFGALGAMMSGSGPTVFAIFDDFDKAKKCVDSFYDVRERFLVQSIQL